MGTIALIYCKLSSKASWVVPSMGTDQNVHSLVYPTYHRVKKSPLAEVLISFYRGYLENQVV